MIFFEYLSYVWFLENLRENTKERKQRGKVKEKKKMKENKKSF